MARATGKAVLDLEVHPTPALVSQGQVQEALDLLQCRLDPGSVQAVAQSPLGAILVAIVKHMGRNGMYLAVSLDESPSSQDGIFTDADAARHTRRLPGQ